MTPELAASLAVSNLQRIRPTQRSDMKPGVLSIMIIAAALFSGCDNEEQMRLEQARQQAEAAAAALREERQAFISELNQYRETLAQEIQRLEERAQRLGNNAPAGLQETINELRTLDQTLEQRLAEVQQAQPETFTALSEQGRQSLQRGDELISQAQQQIEEAQRGIIAQHERAIEQQRARIAEIEQRKQQLEQRLREVQQLERQNQQLERELEQARERAEELQQALQERRESLN